MPQSSSYETTRVTIYEDGVPVADLPPQQFSESPILSTRTRTHMGVDGQTTTVVPRGHTLTFQQAMVEPAIQAFRERQIARQLAQSEPNVVVGVSRRYPQNGQIVVARYIQCHMTSNTRSVAADSDNTDDLTLVSDSPVVI